jgi:hypothetical protein
MTRAFTIVTALAAVFLASPRTAIAQSVTSEQLNAPLGSDPTQWLHYSGDYSGQRHSQLTQITPANASQLATQWAFQTGVLGKLGISTELGTDTAWTFEPHPDEYGSKVLREAGWDGSAPVLVVCPINPFWWPVKASVAKAAVKTLTGAYKESHYRSVYFHNSRASVITAYDSYLKAMSNAVVGFGKSAGFSSSLLRWRRWTPEHVNGCRRCSVMCRSSRRTITVCINWSASCAPAT